MQSQKVFGYWVESRNSPSLDERWEDYELESSFEKNGGVGTVYPVRAKPYVGKLFHENMLSLYSQNDNMARRLIVLVYLYDRLRKELPFVSWPRRVLYRQQYIDPANIQEGLVGFSMDRLKGKISLADVLAKDSERLKLKMKGGLSQTLHIAITIADQLQRMHRHEFKFRFGDLNPNNILLDRRMEQVTFIDPDSYQFDYPHVDDGPYEFVVGGLTDGYSSPASHEARDRNSWRFSKNHDAFVFAILLFQLLMAREGWSKIHPFLFSDVSEDEHIKNGEFLYGERLRQSEALPHLAAIYTGFRFELRDAFEQTFAGQQVIPLATWITLLQNYRRSL